MAEIMDFTSRLIERPPPVAVAPDHRAHAERVWRVVRRMIARGGCVRRISLADNAFVELHRGPPGWGRFGERLEIFDHGRRRAVRQTVIEDVLVQWPAEDEGAA